MLITGAVSSGISKKFIGKVGGKVSRMKTTVGQKKKKKSERLKSLNPSDWSAQSFKILKNGMGWDGMGKNNKWI